MHSSVSRGPVRTYKFHGELIALRLQQEHDTEPKCDERAWSGHCVVQDSFVLSYGHWRFLARNQSPTRFWICAWKGHSPEKHEHKLLVFYFIHHIKVQILQSTHAVSMEQDRWGYCYSRQLNKRLRLPAWPGENFKIYLQGKLKKQETWHIVTGSNKTHGRLIKNTFGIRTKLMLPSDRNVQHFVIQTCGWPTCSEVQVWHWILPHVNVTINSRLFLSPGTKSKGLSVHLPGSALYVATLRLHCCLAISTWVLFRTAASVPHCALCCEQLALKQNWKTPTVQM